MSTNNPKFFKIVQVLAFVVGSAAAVVIYLNKEGVQLPSWFSWIGDLNVVINSVIAMILSQLPNADPVVDEEESK